MRPAASTIARVLARRPLSRLLDPLLRNRACVFMLHRFSQPERGVVGHDPAMVRAVLAWLRRERFELVALGDLVRRLRGDGPPVRRAVAFTLDDGYADQAEVAAPVFAEHGCPVTTFVVTEFLDRRIWMWWDRVEHAFLHARRGTVAVPFGSEVWRGRWQDGASRQAALRGFIQRCKQVPTGEKLRAIDALARGLEVELPGTAPARYEPMSWGQLRRAETAGMHFAPHTMTHPILSRLHDHESHEEIEGSWRRLSAVAAAPQRLFCYPNGRWGDAGRREMRSLEALGFEAAFVSESGYAQAIDARDPFGRYRLRRFAFPAHPTTAARYASGLERLLGGPRTRP